MGAHSFREGHDYHWLSRGPWWQGLPVVSDYTRRAELLRPYVFEAGGRLITIRRGFTWNGVSAGMPFRGTDDPRVMRASLVHDWIYEQRPRGVSQAEADAIFLRMLKEDRAPRWFQWLADSWLAHRLYRWAWERGGVA